MLADANMVGSVNGTGVRGEYVQPNPALLDSPAPRSIPSFQGIIPGGQSFSISDSDFSTVPEQGYGFSWTPPLRIGTTLILTGGDNRGVGTAGSASWVVSQGSNQDCLTSNSPSSTPGDPAGGSYPTSTTSVSTGASSTSSR